jgi:hypothetical protein
MNLIDRIALRFGFVRVRDVCMAIADIPDASRRVALAHKIFGRDGPFMIAAEELSDRWCIPRRYIERVLRGTGQPPQPAPRLQVVHHSPKPKD